MSKRANERLARQLKKGMLDYSASERCILELAERGKLRAVKRVIDRILKDPQPELTPTGRRVPPHRSGGGWPYPVNPKW